MDYLHNPLLYWIFAQIIRLMLLPIVLPVRFYDAFVIELTNMEQWEVKTFVFMLAAAFSVLVGIIFIEFPMLH